MGFGFNFAMIFIVLPLSVLLFLIWFISKKNIFGIIIIVLWGAVIFLVLLSFILKPFYEKIKLEKEDYYGEYVVNREYFAGEQSDWQYNHYRFEIKENDSIYFYVTDENKVIKTFKGIIETTDKNVYNSARLILKMNEPTHHIVSENPTTYRDIWNFYLVFHSSKYSNMFFIKDNWEPIENK